MLQLKYSHTYTYCIYKYFNIKQFLEALSMRILKCSSFAWQRLNFAEQTGRMTACFSIIQKKFNITISKLYNCLISELICLVILVLYLKVKFTKKLNMKPKLSLRIKNVEVC